MRKNKTLIKGFAFVSVAVVFISIFTISCLSNPIDEAACDVLTIIADSKNLASENDSTNMAKCEDAMEAYQDVVDCDCCGAVTKAPYEAALLFGFDLCNP